MLWLLALFAGPLVSDAAVTHVLVISVDGLRGDFLQTLLEDAPEEFPNFVRLRDASAHTYNARCDADYSITNPNHIGMITGRPVGQVDGQPETIHHGYTANGGTPSETIHANGNPAVPYKASIFDVAHDRGLTTAIYLSKSKLNLISRSYDEVNGAPDPVGADNGSSKIDIVMVNEADSPALIDAIAAQIRAGTLARYSFLHIAETDYAGHGRGWSIEEGTIYRAAVRIADGQLGALLDAIDAQPALAGRVAIILTTDHGGGGAGEFFTHINPTAVENYTIPFFVSAAGLSGGSDLYAQLENRANPGVSRPSNAAPHQPIRNTDAANLAAALLGLPPVPDSFVRPELRRPIRLQREGDRVIVSWPAYLTGYQLEATHDLATNAWETVTGPITEAAGQNSHSSEIPPGGARFFRLRSPIDAAVAVAPNGAAAAASPASAPTASDSKPSRMPTRKKAKGAAPVRR